MESLPPCVIYEAGEPLDEWLQRARPDLLTSMNLLCAVAERIADIHATGFVHRDIKPSNILWRRDQGAWTILDFGCAAPMGVFPCSASPRACVHVGGCARSSSARTCRSQSTRTGYMTKITDSKVYVPPETLFAHSVNAHSVSVDAAADVWALGVLMLECFSGTPTAAAYAPVSTFVPGAGTASVAGGTGSITSAASGPVEDDAARLTRALFERLERVSLPRIYGAPVTAEIANELRALRLKMAGSLAREPVRRPGIKQLVVTLQKTRDALQAASAANVWMPHDGVPARPVPTTRPAAPEPEAAAPSEAPPVAATPQPALAAAQPAARPRSGAAAELMPPPMPEEGAGAAASPRAASGNAAVEPHVGRLTGMIDSDARVAKCEAWVSSMQQVTLDRPTMTVTFSDAALDSPPRRATDSMFGPVPERRAGPALDDSSAGALGRRSQENSGAAAAAVEPGRPTFVPLDMLCATDVQTQEVTPLVTSPLELKADSTLDSELAGRHGD